MTKNNTSSPNKAEPQYSQLKQLLESYQNKQFALAEKSALHITHEFPEHPFAWKLLGALLNQTGRISEALDACEKAVLLDPNNAEVHNNLGNTLYKLDRLEEAESSYRKSIAIEPKNSLTHYNLGQALHKCGKLEQAEVSYKEAIAFKQNYVEAYNDLGVVLKSLGRLDEAEGTYNIAIKINQNFKIAHLNRGQLFFDKGEFETALNDFDLCNTARSRVRALSALYALGRTEEVLERVKSQSEEDSENLEVAAIASFVAEVEKKECPHNFCKNPLDFIHFSNISSHFNDSGSFISELIEELNNVNVTWEPFNKSTHKGFQSTANLFESPSGKISLLESIIIDELDSYYSRFENESCIYIKKWPSKKRLKGWHVILKQHGNQDAHIHPSGWLSGVIYLQVVPALGKSEGAIEFGLNGKHYEHEDLPKLIYQPKLGDIVFFPSSLHHRTIPFTSDKDRIIVAFDLMPKGAEE